jgi:hypothetical protein
MKSRRTRPGQDLKGVDQILGADLLQLALDHGKSKNSFRLLMTGVLIEWFNVDLRKHRRVVNV